MCSTDTYSHANNSVWDPPLPPILADKSWLDPKEIVQRGGGVESFMSYSFRLILWSDWRRFIRSSLAAKTTRGRRGEGTHNYLAFLNLEGRQQIRRWLCLYRLENNLSSGKQSANFSKHVEVSKFRFRKFHTYSSQFGPAAASSEYYSTRFDWQYRLKRRGGGGLKA